MSRVLRLIVADDERPARRFLERIPVRRCDEVVILPVRQIAAIVADGELLHITTVANERYTITHRLHALEERLDPRRFVRVMRPFRVRRRGRSPFGASCRTCPAVSRRDPHQRRRRVRGRRRAGPRLPAGAVTAAGTGCMAAIDAERSLSGLGHEEPAQTAHAS